MTRKGWNEFLRLVRYRLLERGYAEAMSVHDIARLTGYSPESIPVLARRLNLPPHPNHGGKIRKRRKNYVASRPRRQAKAVSYYVPADPAPITLAGPEWSWRRA